MNWLRNLLSGRYGIDQLNIALFVISMVLTLISSITKLNFLLYLSYIPLLFCIFRIFSKNINLRVKENNTYCKYFYPIINCFKNQYKLLFGTKTHKYYKCPGCKQLVRVPRGVGKVKVICPKCKTKFMKNT